MKTLKLLLGISALLTFNACVKHNHNPVAPRQEHYSFVEEFNDNRNNWTFADSKNLAYGVISNGTFKIDYNDNLSEAYYVAKGVNLNINSDFVIQTRIGSNKNMGLLFGYDVNNPNGSMGYSLMVDYNGYCALYDEGGNANGSNLVTLVSPMQYSFIRRNGDWNEVKLEQNGNRWIGYINNTQVFNVPAAPLYGAGLGFVVEAQTQGEADYLQADWYQ